MQGSHGRLPGRGDREQWRVATVVSTVVKSPVPLPHRPQPALRAFFLPMAERGSVRPASKESGQREFAEPGLSNPIMKTIATTSFGLAGLVYGSLAAFVVYHGVPLELQAFITFSVAAVGAGTGWIVGALAG